LTPRTDIHEHLLPPALIAKLRLRTRPPMIADDGGVAMLRLKHELGGPVDLTKHDPAVRIAALDEAGIDRAAISLSTPYGIEALPAEESVDLIRAYHDGIAEVVADSDGRLLAWAATPLTAGDDGLAELDRALDAGMVGASIASEAMSTPKRLEALGPALELLERRGRAVFVHPGPAADTEPYSLEPGTPKWWPNLAVYPGLSLAAFFAWRIAGAERYPRLRICFAVAGGGAPFMEERWRTFSGESRGIDRNLFVDTASFGRLALECALATYGVEQVVFGTDVPVISAGTVTHALSELGPAAEQAVVQRNPVRLLDLKE
jgi:predicted TIM-barrel fold metal-dependent hydrolase